MQGELIIIAVGLVVALAFSTLIKSFTDSIITPLVNAAEGGGRGSRGLGWTINGQPHRARNVYFGNRLFHNPYGGHLLRPRRSLPSPT